MFLGINTQHYSIALNRFKTFEVLKTSKVCGHIEQAMLNGEIVKSEEDDLRGVKYTLLGFADDADVKVAIVGRFKETKVYLIITVYAITE